jgi:hypothetical protein
MSKRTGIALFALLALAVLPASAQASTAELSPTSLGFPDTLIGVSSPDQQVFFTNDGPDPIDVSGVSIGGADPTDFAVTQDNCTGATLGDGESCDMRVGFAPTARGPLSADLDVAHTGDASPATAPLSGNGVIKELSPTPTQLDFPTTTVFYPGGQQGVDVKNTGDQPVGINNVSIDGPNGSDFNQNNNCGGQLDVGQSCHVNVSFQPQGAGNRSATLRLSSDASRGDTTVDLSGIGADPSLGFEPASYDFGLQRINNGSAQTNLQVRNTGAAAVQVNSIDIVGPGSSNFWTGFSSCWGTTLQPNDTCTVQVNFGPNDTIDYSAQLRVSVNGVQFTADLTGRGGQAVVVGSPNPADFGTATTGQSGLTRTITLTNTGELPGGFFVAVVSGGDVASFRLLHENCTGHPLDPSASCTAQVRFQPDSPGAKVAQLSIFGDQDGGAQVNLTGVGLDPQASLTPASHDFGRQAVDSTSRGQTFELSNDGDGSMRLNGASLVGSDADQYRLAGDDCTDVVLASGERCAVQVKFAPDLRGQATGRLRISGDGGSFSSSLAGTGVAKANVGVRLQWRKALRPQGAHLVAGKAACHLASGCKLKASAILLTKVHRGTAVRHLAVKLPTIRMTIGGGATRALRLRLTKAARTAARGGGHVRLDIDWSADGHRGHTSSKRQLAA